MKSTFAAAIAALILFLGCNANQTFVGTPIDQKQAEEVAIEEAIRRGWQGANVRSSKWNGRVWMIMLDLLPDRLGSDALVKVTGTGKVIGYIPGA
jgi:hypothetical protein